MNSKKWIKIFSVLSVCCLALIVGINLIIDPLKLFHKPYFLKENLNSNMRLQAAGIIKNYDFNSIILGTSMLENTSSKEASNVLGGKFMNISLSGSDFYERSFPLHLALETKQVKKVIYSLDYSGLKNSRMGRRDFSISNFDYLYDSNTLNDLKSYVNLELPKCALKFNFSPCFGRKTNFDSPNEWYSDKIHSSRFGGLDNWFKAKNNNQIRDAFKEISNSIKKIKNAEVLDDKERDNKVLLSKNYLDKYLVKYAIEYPQTEFILVIPPYSRIQNAINAQYKKSDFYRVKESIKYLVHKSNEFKNIKVYGWGDKDFPDDIANYKDLRHYGIEINSKMLSWIKNNDGLLTSNNIEVYLKEFTKKSLNYNVISIGEKIEVYLSNNK